MSIGLCFLRFLSTVCVVIFETESIFQVLLMKYRANANKLFWIISFVTECCIFVMFHTSLKFLIRTDTGQIGCVSARSTKISHIINRQLSKIQM